MAIAAALLKKLVQIPIFQGLTVPQAAEFFEVSHEDTVVKGAKVFSEGDDGDSLLVVLDGEVVVTKQGVELATVGKHSVLGEMSLMGDGVPRSATATASRDVKLLRVPASRVQMLLRDESLAALKVVANSANVLSKRLALINEKFVQSRAKKEELADFGKILNKWSF